MVVCGLSIWGAAALWFSANGGFTVLYVVAIIGTFVLPKKIVHRWLGAGGAFGVVLVWWCMIPPSNERDWLPDVAVLPYATMDGNRITVHNIRNCDYRSGTDFDVRHYDATYDLGQLRRVDLFLSYWGSPSIAHTMMSFGFEDGRYLCFSIETRKEKSEEYSAIKGFFKQYELTYVVADERDVIRVRTNYRNEDVYCYRLKTSADIMRSVLLDYLKCVNNLRARPEWYNALTSNCTTNIRGHTKPYAPNARWDWRLLINGYLPQMIYERGAMTRRLSFDEWRERSRVTDRAKRAGGDVDFSSQIRQGLPEPEMD